MGNYSLALLPELLGTERTTVFSWRAQQVIYDSLQTLSGL